MDATFLDVIMGHFLGALSEGFNRLYVVAFPLLWVVGGVAWVQSLVTIMASGGGGGALLAGICTFFCTLGLYLLGLAHLHDWAMITLDAFARWGTMVGGVSVGGMETPSAVLTMGFTMTKKLLVFTTQMISIFHFASFGIAFLGLLCLLCILGAFAVVAYYLVLAILTFHFALLAAPILLPWGLLQPTKELAVMSFTQLLSSAVRVFFTSAAFGIGVPLFEGAVPDLTVAGDPKLHSVFSLTIGVLIWTGLTLAIAKLAGAIGGRGYAFELPGTTLLPPGTWQAARLVTNMALQGAANAITFAGQRVGGGPGVGGGMPSGVGRTSTRNP